MVRAWLAIARAPATARDEYRAISEADIHKSAKTVAKKFGASDFGFRAPETLKDRDFIRALGGFLRAAENELSQRDEGGRPADPHDDWAVTIDDELFFCIPLERIAWREAKPARKDFRIFQQRGLKRFRIIPQIIDGVAVRLYRPDRFASNTDKRFGATLFRSVRFGETKHDDGFLITQATIDDGLDQLRDSCRFMHSDLCLAAVLPEVTIDNASLQFIMAELKAKPWLEVLPQAFISPGLVVAGSWHKEISEGVFANIATVLDGDGEILLEYRKRLPYRDANGLCEAIERGEELPVLVLDEGLFGFGICLDFCDRTLPSPYEKMDMDFILITSCGNDRTMDGHLRSAMDLEDQLKTRTFVVQQAYPDLSAPGLGFVLPPGVRLSGKTAQDFVSSKTWETFAI